jgi:D-alanyl-D-alanine carboxypeptidase
MKKVSILLLPLLFLYSSCVFNANEKVDTSPLQNVLDSLYQENQELLGILIHIEAPNKNLSWSGAVGLSNKNDTISIDPLISANSRKILSDDGYDLTKIQIKHLLSQTSGIYDFTVSKTFNDRVEFQPNYRWTRDEQIKLATDEGDPIAEPESVFKYSDTNYLLLTEIIEKLTGQVFYTAMRKLLKYDQFNLYSTWFYTLEEDPVDIKPFVTQYSGDCCASNREDPSFDLFGGGGLAATTSDMALFTQYLYTGELFDHPETVDLIFTEVKTMEEPHTFYKSYRMGVMEFEINGKKAFGHRGFWGTYNLYIPHLNTSFGIAISNESEKFELMQINFVEGLLDELEKYEVKFL